jgi:hypothetical protein
MMVAIRIIFEIISFGMVDPLDRFILYSKNIDLQLVLDGRIILPPQHRYLALAFRSSPYDRNTY